MPHLEQMRLTSFGLGARLYAKIAAGPVRLHPFLGVSRLDGRIETDHRDLFGTTRLSADATRLEYGLQALARNRLILSLEITDDDGATTTQWLVGVLLGRN